MRTSITTILRLRPGADQEQSVSQVVFTASGRVPSDQLSQKCQRHQSEDFHFITLRVVCYHQCIKYLLFYAFEQDHPIPEPPSTQMNINESILAKSWLTDKSH